MLLPFLSDEDSVRVAVERLDGLLLSGGGDIVSLAYGEEPHPKSHYQDPARDEMEFALVRAALERNIPILGICRGIQTLNVALGGTLVQDIESQVPGAIKHFSSGLAPVLLHSVQIDPDSLLARVLGGDSLAVNSWHHQAVKDVAPALRVNCKASDGVIEGLESAEGRDILAVQWHPEEIAAAYPQFRSLFDWLVNSASG